jgi:hypothetical protein
VRFAHSFHLVRATVGSTAKQENLVEFLNAVKNIKPLPTETINELIILHSKWSDEIDINAEPWTM